MATWGPLAVALALCALAAARAARRAGPLLGAFAFGNAGTLFAIGYLAPWPAFVRGTAIVAGIAALARALALSRLRRGDPAPPLSRGLLFLALYPGVDPARGFVRDPGADRAAGGRALLVGLLEVVAGLVLGVAAVRAGLPSHGPYPIAWARAATLVLFLDGTFRGAMGALRALGLRSEAVFRSPWLLSDLADFWGRRWNRIVGKTLAREVHDPLRPRVGRGVAVLATFLASGLLHEASIAAPASGPYGRYVAFFLAHGAAMLVLARAGRAARRVAAWAVLLATAPLFFGDAYAVVLPLERVFP